MGLCMPLLIFGNRRFNEYVHSWRVCGVVHLVFGCISPLCISDVLYRILTSWINFEFLSSIWFYIVPCTAKRQEFT